MDGTLILVADHEKQSFLIGVDSASGTERWRTARPPSDAGTYASPAPYRPKNGAPQVAVAGDMEIAGYSAATGKKLWWVQGLPIQPKASPTVDGGVIYYAIPALVEGGLPNSVRS